MRKHPEIKWGEVARRAISEYLSKLGTVSKSSEVLQMLLQESRMKLADMSQAEARRFYSDTVKKEMETREVLDTTLLIEGKIGLTTAFNVVEYPKALESENDVLWPEREDHVTGIPIMVDLLKAGTPLPATDVLIAAVCIKRGFKLLTKDTHFKNMKSVRPSFKLQLLKWWSCGNLQGEQN